MTCCWKLVCKIGTTSDRPDLKKYLRIVASSQILTCGISMHLNNIEINEKVIRFKVKFLLVMDYENYESWTERGRGPCKTLKGSKATLKGIRGLKKTLKGNIRNLKCLEFKRRTEALIYSWTGAGVLKGNLKIWSMASSYFERCLNWSGGLKTTLKGNKKTLNARRRFRRTLTRMISALNRGALLPSPLRSLLGCTRGLGL